MKMTPTNTRASHGETAEEWINRSENVLRLTENSAEHAASKVNQAEALEWVLKHTLMPISDFQEDSDGVE